MAIVCFGAEISPCNSRIRSYSRRDGVDVLYEEVMNKYLPCISVAERYGRFEPMYTFSYTVKMEGRCSPTIWVKSYETALCHIPQAMLDAILTVTNLEFHVYNTG
jgi:hypothetical protein